MLTADQARRKTQKVVLKENKEMLVNLETKIKRAIEQGKGHISIKFENNEEEVYNLSNYLRSLGYVITRNPKTEVWYIGWE